MYSLTLNSTRFTFDVFMMCFYSQSANVFSLTERNWVNTSVSGSKASALPWGA